MWAVYYKDRRLTKLTTEYEATYFKMEWDRVFSNLELREIKAPAIPTVAVIKKGKKQRKNRIIRPVEV